MRSSMDKVPFSPNVSTVTEGERLCSLGEYLRMEPLYRMLEAMFCFRWMCPAAM